jgi:CubicO group peptidase (beta-lactamase class C family)
MALSQQAEDRIARVLEDLRPEPPPYPGASQPGRALAERMAQLATPGASVAVVDDGAVAWARGFGVGALGGEAVGGEAVGAGAVTPHTLFQAGSISKPVFALAVMRLVEERVLDLDADVNSYLTAWRVPANARWQPRVTLRQLLSHSAGTTVHGFPGYPAAGPWPGVAQVLDGVPPANMPPVTVDLLPGTQFRYSGGGTTIAQQAVVDVTGTPFPALMRRLVLDPLGMHDSSFEQPLPPPLAGRAAHAHPWNHVATRGGWHVYPEMAAAGLWTTAGDLAKLGVAVLRARRGAATPLGLSRDSVAAMLRPQLPDQKIGDEFYGIGWACAGQDDAFRFGHMGADEGFLAQMRMFPARDCGAVVMINSIQGWRLRDELLAAIGRAYGWPALTPAREAATLSEGIAYAGQYRSAHGAAAVVARDAGSLTLAFGAQPPLPLTPASASEFFATALDLRVVFEDIASKTPAALTIVQGGKTIRLARA